MMKAVLALLTILLVTALAVGQSDSSRYRGGGAASPPYQPSVPNAPQVYTGGGWGGSGSPGTVAGSAMQGMASMASAAGSYNLATSAAAVNMSQARKQEIQNYDEYVNTYFATRDANRQARKAEEGPQLTAAQLNRIAQEGAPKPLATQQLDPVSGTIFWPDLLQDGKFESQRALLDEAFVWRANHGNFNFTQLEKVRQMTDEMLSQLKDIVREVAPMDYATAKKFIQSLAYEARRPVA